MQNCAMVNGKSIVQLYLCAVLQLGHKEYAVHVCACLGDTCLQRKTRTTLFLKVMGDLKAHRVYISKSYMAS